MALDLHHQWFQDLAELRCSATAKRLRAYRDGTVVVDTVGAMLVWEPRRVVPEYAVRSTTSWRSGPSEPSWPSTANG